MTTSINNNSPIAFFDSGIGGLTVLNKVKAILPNESFLYYGDTLHMPYGEKSKEELLEYSNNIFKFFEQKGAKAVVMACNTTSSVIFDDVKGKYEFKLYPIVQSVSKILANLNLQTLGIFATRATIDSKAYENEIKRYNSSMCVVGRYCPSWVHIVENNAMNIPENIEIIKYDLEQMLRYNPEKIVLGCTHYPFLTDVLSNYVSSDMFIDPAIDFANFIKEDLEKNNILANTDSPYEEFYVSSNPELFQSSAKMFYNVKDLPKLLTF